MSITSSYTVGKEVLSVCTKCKLTLSHIIVSMKNDRIVGKVKCNTCKGIHQFKDPAAKAVTRKKSTTRGYHSEKNAPNPLKIWEDAMGNGTAPKSYSLKAKFAAGDVIHHPQFGDGVIERLIDNNKISVIFQFSKKILIHNS